MGGEEEHQGSFQDDYTKCKGLGTGRSLQGHGGWEGVLSQSWNRTFVGGGDKPQKDKVRHRAVCNGERKDGFQGQLNRPRVGLVLVQVGGWGESHSDI